MGGEEEGWEKTHCCGEFMKTTSHMNLIVNIGKRQPCKLNKMANPYEPDCVYLLQCNY